MTGRTTPKKPKPVHAKDAFQQRPLNELKFAWRGTPPGSDDPVLIEVELRTMTLAERQLVKRGLALMVSPDWSEIVIVHVWVIWRRTHPEASLSEWMGGLSFGDVLDGVDMDPDQVDWDTTPEGWDPEV